MKKNTSKQEKRYTPRALLRSGRYSAYSKDFLSVILTEPAYTLEEADRAAKRAAVAKIWEEQRAAREAERVEREQAREREQAVKEMERLYQRTLKANPIDALTGRLTRMVVMLFSVRRLMGYIQSAGDRAPDEIAGSFAGLKSGISDAGARAIVSLMKGMQGGVDRLLRSMNSPAGQKFFRGLERSADAAGRVVGKALDLIGGGIEWIGDHGETAFTIAGVALAFFAAQMLVTAGAAAAANLPLLLFVGIIAMVISGLNQAGITAGEVFGFIGGILGGLYAFAYNIVADLFNIFASLGEFFANLFVRPAAAAKGILADFAAGAERILSPITKVIDYITDNQYHLTEGLSAWAREKAEDAARDPNPIRFPRMEHIDYGDIIERWSQLGREFGDSLSDFSLADALAQPIKAIESDVADIRKSVSLTAEDLKSLVDVAVRRYVNHISLTSQTPVITVNGANTGRTAEDRQALADAIAEVLIEQTASGSTVDARTPT